MPHLHIFLKKFYIVIAKCRKRSSADDLNPFNLPCLCGLPRTNSKSPVLRMRVPSFAREHYESMCKSILWLTTKTSGKQLFIISKGRLRVQPVGAQVFARHRGANQRISSQQHATSRFYSRRRLLDSGNRCDTGWESKMRTEQQK